MQKVLTLEPSSAAPRLAGWPCGVDRIAPGWQPLVERFLASDAGAQLGAALGARLAAGAEIYPPLPLRALELTPPEAVRVVIWGQDPYHGPGQSNGLAFAVGPGVTTPPSLRNIFKELAREYGRAPTSPAVLEHWARQGVLLLNRVLTVEAGRPLSHARLGWQAFTDAIGAHLLAQERPLVGLLWGASAHALEPAAPARADRLWLKSNHPSPLSALRPPVPFIGCGHFQRANAFLTAHGVPAIDWLGDAPVPQQAPPELAARSQTLA